RTQTLTFFPYTTLFRSNREPLRMDFYARSKKLLRKSSKTFDNRAYPDPVRLIAAISDGTFQLQASLQYEGGLRTEGVGAPSNRRDRKSTRLNSSHVKIS